jgi:Zn-dependent protease
MTAQQLVLRLCGYLLVCAVHGYALARIAGAMGDPGPRYDGRCTLNPLRHADLVGGVLAVVFGFGWIRPVRLDRQRLAWGGWGTVLIALVGLAAVAGLALVAEALRRPLIQAASGNLTLYGIALLEVLVTQAAGFVLINLVPLPPFTGQHFLVAAAPRVAPVLHRYRFGFVAAAALFVASGLAERLVLPAYRPLVRWLLGA